MKKKLSCLVPQFCNFKSKLEIIVPSGVVYKVKRSGLCKVVVVVNHCFTSLFGTNCLLSDIVIRRRCCELMR